MPKVNLTERLYYSDTHEHIELFYSWNSRPCGGKKGQKTKTEKKELPEITTNKEKTIAFSSSVDSSAVAEALEKKQRSQQESLARTRRDMKRFLYSRLFGHHIRFVTLTYAVAPSSESEARKDLYACMDRYSVMVGHKVQWMAVPEHGSENGRFHWHLLFNSHYVRNEVFQKEYWKKGFVKISKIKTKKNMNQQDSALHYMMKYISKDIEAGKAWRHRWFHSRGVKVVHCTTGHRVSHSEFSLFCRHLEGMGFKCLSKDTWKDGDFGQCTRLHYAKLLPVDFKGRNILSHFVHWKNLDCDVNYYGFAVSQEIEALADGECEDFPSYRAFLATDTVKQIFYDKIKSVKRYLYLQNMYYRQLWFIYQPYRADCLKRGDDLHTVYPWFVNTGRIESFEHFLLNTSFFYVPECVSVKEL